MNFMLNVRIAVTIVAFSAWQKNKVTGNLELVDIEKMLIF
jgi:hypothetical protein